MKEGFVVPEFENKLPKIDTDELTKYVSYSQFSTFQKCPQQWKLVNVDKIKLREASIHTIFGDSMHTVIQHYLKVLFTETVKKSNELDFGKMLSEEMKQNYTKEVEKQQKHFLSKEELTEFYVDGLEILNFLRKKRTRYFDKKHEELIGIEVPLAINTNNDSNIYLKGYLDVIFRDKTDGKIRILDLKTSTKGWSDYDRKDETKIAQLLLYKVYFSKQYNVSIDNIDVEFIILKRKIQTDSMYPIPRIQVFKPAQGNISYNKALKEFNKFISSCFLPDGSFNEMFKFEAKCGRNNFNCRYCEFDSKEDLCPKQNRIQG